MDVLDLCEEREEGRFGRFKGANMSGWKMHAWEYISCHEEQIVGSDKKRQDDVD